MGTILEDDLNTSEHQQLVPATTLEYELNTSEHQQLVPATTLEDELNTSEHQQLVPATTLEDELNTSEQQQHVPATLTSIAPVISDVKIYIANQQEKQSDNKRSHSLWSYQLKFKLPSTYHYKSLCTVDPYYLYLK